MPLVSVIIPVFHEASIINKLIGHIRAVASGCPIEILVVDGDPSGGTIGAIQDVAVKTAISKKGRGNQLNHGASLANGDILLFLHADTRLPLGAFDQIKAVLKTRKMTAGAFRLSIDSHRPVFRIIEKGVFFRSHYLGLPYGDQGFFIGRQDFQALGGFRDIPVMEDVEIVQRFKKHQGRIVILDSSVMSSARRWEKEGISYCTLRNWFLIVLFFLGVPPEKLQKLYPAHVA